MVRTLLKSTLYITALFTLIACGGGSSSSDDNQAVVEVPVVDTPIVDNDSTPFSGLASFSGIVTYTDYPLSASEGILYEEEQLSLVRGAVIQLQDANGTVLDSSNTNSSGAYALSGNVDGFARIVVRAELSENNTVNTRVIDNTSNGAVYAIFSDIIVTSNTVVQNLNADSGWDGTRYSGTRAAAPFSLLDVIYQSQALVRNVDSDVSFSFLSVNWSPLNTTVNGTVADGEIGTSFYSNNQMFILGDENTDTDEYDKAVVAHEWGHYFEDNFSRSDSIGGPHAQFDLLNPTVSWSEGLATALSSMILQDPLYIDTFNAGQSSAFVINAELDTDDDRLITTLGDRPRIDGYYSEMSVTEIVYDIYDDGSINNNSTDDDGVALGFAPIYNVLINDVAETEAFTSLFAFLHYIRLEEPNSVEGINSVGNNENIDMANINEFDNPVDTALVPVYTNISAGSTISVDGNFNSLQTSNDYGSTTTTDAGNKLLNQRFFKATAAEAGCYTLTATPVAPTATADIRILFTERFFSDRFFNFRETVSQFRDADEVFTFKVDAFIDNAFFNVSFELTPNACS